MRLEMYEIIVTHLITWSKANIKCLVMSCAALFVSTDSKNGLLSNRYLAADSACRYVLPCQVGHHV